MSNPINFLKGIEVMDKPILMRESPPPDMEAPPEHVWVYASGGNLLTRDSDGNNAASNLVVQDEGSSLATAATILNFTGAGVTASGTGSTKTVNIPGGGSGLTVQDEGTPLATAATTLNFVGSGVVASGTGASKTITIAGGGSALTVQDEGTPLATDATTLNFVGAGVTASGTGATKTITIAGGGGGGSAVWTEVAHLIEFTTDADGLQSLGTSAIIIMGIPPLENNTARTVQLISAACVQTYPSAAIWVTQDPITPYGYKPEIVTYRYGGSSYLTSIGGGWVLGINLKADSYGVNDAFFGYVKARSEDSGAIQIFPNDNPTLPISSTFKIMLTIRYRDVAL
jgi:hypothetical protein